MSSNTGNLSAVEFKERMKQGTDYEKKIQKALSKSSFQCINNVRVANVEFDAVVIGDQYPLITLIEIKAYRKNLNVNRVRKGFKYFRDKALRCIIDDSIHPYLFIPYLGKGKVTESLTKKELLLKKIGVPIKISAYYEAIGIDLTNIWKFQLVFIVPDKVITQVTNAVAGIKAPNERYDLSIVDEIPIIILPESKIPYFFY